MNFFKLYIGDYQRDTAHLSVTEHGAYLLMLQHYYATEKPLPTGKALHRMLRAQDKAERDAIDAVAAQFWTVTDAGLVNGRADEEITKAGAQAETNARIAREREAKRKAAREQHDKSTNRATNDQPNHSHSQTPEEIQDASRLVGSPPVGVASDPDSADGLEPAGAQGAPPRYAVPPCPADAIVAAYAAALPMLPQVAVLNDARRRAIGARWREVCAPDRFDRAQGLDWFAWFFGHVATSPFLTGRAAAGRDRSAPFRADFDWLLNPTNFARVVEGRYHHQEAHA